MPEIDLFDGLLSANVSDAMERLGLRRSVIHNKVVLAASGLRVVGKAFTIRQTWKSPSEPRNLSLVRHSEVARKLAQPGQIIVIDTGGITEVATWGENHSLRCIERGIVGMVTNGATRDANLIRDLGFPVYCRGVSPVKSLWNLKTELINEPIMIDNVHIRPNDIVFCDETGVVIIPCEKVADVATAARAVRAKELQLQADRA